jgi:hypothetical protein
VEQAPLVTGEALGVAVAAPGGEAQQHIALVRGPLRVPPAPQRPHQTEPGLRLALPVAVPAEDAQALLEMR